MKLNIASFANIKFTSNYTGQKFFSGDLFPGYYSASSCYYPNHNYHNISFLALDNFVLELQDKISGTLNLVFLSNLSQAEPSKGTSPFQEFLLFYHRVLLSKRDGSLGAKYSQKITQDFNAYSVLASLEFGMKEFAIYSSLQELFQISANNGLISFEFFK